MKRNEPSIQPELTTLPRCPVHRHALLRGDGTCPTCEREQFMARVKSEEDAMDARRLQAMTRALAGKWRTSTLQEVMQ